ncbi:NAD(P)-dependent alcohol dehydrogenase [Novosphingobium sp. KCTC 2891]|uniref:NAD(P)-dependent alcohol dehydrogenase n=1 Tax=Novosphingobium sp. KCTC 2891 TaxID=2989730 RepID=UPI002221F3FC|nr:NAD(P)-dependent alcohol dehydrogenase [Novosphingobium sp. KCTC 2891]MCW1384746.1 NAD(P)-dependent alcohol dehydrogenase [Novosphingobium sp. KCTC 2891]
MTVSTAAVARGANADFTIEQIEVAAPRAGEVRVAIAGVGLCHTDLVFRDQVETFAKPAVLGHEGAGVIEAVGEGVEGLAVGDKVMLGFSSCGGCPRCDEHLPSYCNLFVPLNYAGLRLEDGSTAYSKGDERMSSHFFGQSSFSALAITRARNVVKVPEGVTVPLEYLGTLGCGFQTGAGAVLRSMDAQEGSSLVVFGGGPVGLSAVMAGVIRKCSTIILVEPVAARREIALEFGATHVIDPKAVDDLGGAIRAILPLGVDSALDTTGVVPVIEAGLGALAPHGVIGLVGVPHQPDAAITVNITALMTPGLRIIGIIEGDSEPQDFIPELLAYHAQGKFPFDRLIKTFPLAEINEAIAAQSRGECIKVVLVP